MRRGLIAAALLLATSVGTVGRAAEVRVAVAANFATTLDELATTFELRSGHRISASVGSTGKLYAQIVHGAPFDVFLSGDAERPARLEAERRAVVGTRFTYASGRLALWSAEADLVDARGEVLRREIAGRLALPNPDLAPFGRAARQTLERLGLWSRWSSRLVLGEDVGQTFQFIATGNAPLGFVSLAQVRRAGRGSWWQVPAKLHDPLEQQAVLLERGRDNPAARELLDFLRGAEARSVIERLGYAPGE